MYKIKMLESYQELLQDKEYIMRIIDMCQRIDCIYDLEGILVASVPDSELLYEMVL